MSRFFINRPIFAWVIAITTMLAGLLAIDTLSISRYPQIAPPTISITSNYAGADAQTVENSVTKVIEQGMTGLDNLDYMSSTSTSTGQSQITLTFKNGANADVAQMQVQNKLQLVQAQLPSTVTSSGITVDKASSGFLMVASFVSTDGKLSNIDLSDFVDSSLNDTLKRVPGVGSTQLFGASYAMRIWLDPDKLAKYSLMPGDIAAAVQAQNAQISAGQLGGLPAVKGQQINATITARSRLQTPEQFRSIILKSGTDGSLVRLDDVARVELGAKSYTSESTYNSKPAAGLAINLATGANAISTAQAVQAAIAQMKPIFPQNVEVVYPYDTTPFVVLSIEEVVKTLAEAIALVFIVMLVFLQNIRATLIPTLAVPVVLLGTFAVLSVAGYSINTLTMFAMVLAIGLLVDDAIVVVENVERVMTEQGLGPREATILSMREITGALVGIATVLSAVFIPMAFFGGAVGVIYRQFSVTIVAAMVLSVMVAMILSPALCATILKRPADHAANRGIFGLFNRGFDAMTRGYGVLASFVIRRAFVFIVLFLAIVGGAGYLFVKLPSSFLPEEDQGILLTLVTLPVGSTQDRTVKVLDDISQWYRSEEKKAVDGVMTVAGFGFGGQGQNVGIVFVRLRDYAERTAPELSSAAVAGRAMRHFFTVRQAQIFALSPPAIQGMGNNSGFDFYLQDRGGAGHEKLMQVRNMLLGMASQNQALMGTRPNGQEDTPQFTADVDQEKASALGLSLSDIDATLSYAWGSLYVNDFIDRGRVKSVYLQGDAPFRRQPQDLDRWHVRNSNGEMVPFSAFLSGHWSYGSPRLERYNGSPAVEIQGASAPGVSSGTAMDIIDQLTASLPTGFGHEWTGLSAQERLSGSQATSLYAISALVVFLCLAALYESWSVPFAVMLSIPIGVFGALGAASLFGQTNDVYFKVGLLTTMGLAAKNAILIVEFALEREASGMPLIEATIAAARQRLRPILMTSLAFILGVAPLAVAHGAGSGAQNSIGIGVMGGMIAATVLGVFFVPMLFVIVRKLFPRRVRPTDSAVPQTPAPEHP